MKGELFHSRFALLFAPAADVAVASDRILNEVDTGNARNGCLCLSFTPAAASDIRNLEIWTSNRSDFSTAGTALAAVASDSLRQVVLQSDASSFYAQGALGATISDVTVSAAGTVAAINETGLYVFNLKHLARYVNVQYDSSGLGSRVSACFQGHDLEHAPWDGARTAY